MRDRRRSDAVRSLLLVVAAVSLLLLLLVPHATAHGGFALFWVALIPVFLFGRIVPLEAFAVPASASEQRLASPARPALFQRPPPSSDQ